MNSNWAPKILAAAIAVFPILNSSIQAQDAGALVDKLIKKGILTDQEGEEVRADMMRDFSQTSAGKVNLNSSITELKLSGDLRLRYQYDNRQPQVDNPTNLDQRSTFRYRLRIGADATLGANWSAGFQLQSGQNADSANQTFSNGFDNDAIFISRAFFGWKNDWASVTAGKQKNPFYTTDMVWDNDINPSGVIETIALHKLWGRRSAGEEVIQNSNWELNLITGQLWYQNNNEFAAGADFNTDGFLFVEQLVGSYRFSNDVKITIAPAWMTWTAAHLTNFRNENAYADVVIYGPTVSTKTTTSVVNTTEETVNATGTKTTRIVTPTTVTSVVTTTTNPDGSTSVNTQQSTVRPGSPITTILAVGGTPNQKTTSAKTIASATSASVPIPGPGALPAVSGESRGLNILTAPGDVSFKIGSLKSKAYWDFAYNLDGPGRYNDIYQLKTGNIATDSPHRYTTEDGIAWLVGLQVGETKKAGDWSVIFNYRRTGIASIDPNLNDSDFALGELNVQGFTLRLAYQVADACVMQLSGYMAWNLVDNLSGGRATNRLNPTNAGIAQDNAVNVLQFDVNIKF